MDPIGHEYAQHSCDNLVIISVRLIVSNPAFKMTSCFIYDPGDQFFRRMNGKSFYMMKIWHLIPLATVYFSGLTSVQTHYSKDQEKFLPRNHHIPRMAIIVGVGYRDKMIVVYAIK